MVAGKAPSGFPVTRRPRSDRPHSSVRRPRKGNVGRFDGLLAVPVSSRHARHEILTPRRLASSRPPRVRLAEALRPGRRPGTRTMALAPRPPSGLRHRKEVLILRRPGSEPAPAPGAFEAAPPPEDVERRPGVAA